MLGSRSAALAAMAMLAATASQGGASAFELVRAERTARAPGASAVVDISLQQVTSQAAVRRAILGRYASIGRARRAGYGWTNRHAKRVALKLRNQARHRAAGRGKGRA